MPAIAKMPGGQQGVVRDEFVSLCDFAPTLLEMGAVVSPVEFAGTSLMPLLKGETPADWRDALFFQTNGNETYGIQRSVVTDKWRFVYNGFDYDELYDLESDPGQMQNLAPDPQYSQSSRRCIAESGRSACARGTLAQRVHHDRDGGLRTGDCGWKVC